MTANANLMLNVRNLQIGYPLRRSLSDAMRSKPRSRVRAVDGVDLTVAPGEMVALVGESGCGKSTTAQAVLGMVSADDGTVEVDGVDLGGISERRRRSARRRVQMVYQDPYESLDPRFRVGQTIEEPMAVHDIGGTRGNRRRLVCQALERTGLSPAELFLDRYPHELSGGQRQRVAIAAALAVNPSLLVADEPVSMLDVSVRASILSLLDGLRRDSALGILMITHDLSTAVAFADRIAVMYLGRIVEVGLARDIADNAQHPYTKALLSVVPVADPRRRTRPQILSGEAPDPKNIPPGCRFNPRCPVGPKADSSRTICLTSDPSAGRDERVNSAACHFVPAARAEAAQ